MRRGCGALLLAFLCILLPSKVLQGQTPDPVPVAITPQNNTGDLPYSTSVGSPTEHVELASGNLIVTIPFVSVPGRKMSFDYGIRFDARFWIQRQNSGVFYWAPDQQRAWLVPGVLGWSGTQGSLSYSKGSTYCIENDGGEGSQTGSPSTILYKGGPREDGFVFTDRQGVKHTFLVNIYDSGECDRSVPPAEFVASNVEGPSPDMDGFNASLAVNTLVVHGPDGTFYGGASEPVVSGGSSDTAHGLMYAESTGERDPQGNTQSVAAGDQDSIGRTPLTMVVNGNQIVYTVHDSNGSPQTYTVNLVATPIATQFGVHNYREYTGNANLVSSVILPNGRSYSFQYDAWGCITQMVLPSGAVINYQWSTIALGTMRSITQRSITHDGQTDTWDFSYGSSGYWGTVTVTSPADASGQRYVTIYYYDGEQHLSRVQYLGNSNPASQLLQYDITWDTSRPNPNPNAGTTEDSLMTSLTTTLENGLVSRKVFDYDLYAFPYQTLNCGDNGPGFWICMDYASGSVSVSTNGGASTPFVPVPPTNLPSPTPQPGSHGNVTAIREYDWGQGAPGSLIRQTIRTYLQDQDQAYFVTGTVLPGVSGRTYRNIVNRVTDQSIYDGSAVCAGTGTWSPANDGTITPPAACKANKLAETKIVYDNGSGTTDGYLGEATSISQWAGGTAYLTTTFTYDQYGNVISETDPKGNTTTYGYADAWTGSSACSVPANSSAYLTSITNPLQQKSTQTFYECTGKVASQTDANSNTVSLTYDWLGRPLYVKLPGGGQTSTTYDDTALTTTVDQLMSAGQIHQMITQLDQLGRAVQTRLTSDAQGTVYTDTTYDALGRINTISNPYRSKTTDATYGITQTYYDARSRKVQQVNPDRTILSWSYSGNTATSTNEADNSWIHTSDAFGRLKNVVEPSGAKTGYNYDALDNLLTVNQLGNSSTETARTRSFTYDSLSRLVTSTNPETGTICYGQWSSGSCQNGYDANSNLSYKTDARGITTNYSYDALNRVTGKSSAGANGVPGFTYTYGYDDATHSNGIGRLTASSNNTNSAENFFYDAMGRLDKETYCVPDNCSYGIQVAATYDLAGNITSLTYPDGRTVSQGIDGAGRVSSVNYASWNGTAQTSSYLTETNGYDAAGHLVNATLGNGTGLGAGYDPRERITQLVYGTTTQMLWGKQYQWTSNSNLQGITDGITGTQRQFRYDNLNRLISAQDIVGTPPASAPPPTSGPASGLDGSAGATPAPYWTDPDDSNTLINPETPGSSGWAESAASITGNVAAPDGSMTAYTFTASSGATDSYLEDSVSDAYQYVGETMTGSVWLRSPNGNQTVNLYLVEQPGANGYNLSAWKPVTVTTAWQQFQVSGQFQSGYGGLALQIGGGGSVTSGETVSLWGAMVEDTGSSGPDVTNFLPYSQRLTASTWSGQAVTPSDNTALAPDGTNTAATLKANAGSTDSYISDTAASPAAFSGLPVTGSVWLRSATGPQSVLLTVVEFGTGPGNSQITSGTVALTGNWQRFQVSGTTINPLTNLVFQIGGAGTFTNGSSIQVWGAQLELASTAGPYVATGAAVVSAGTNLTNLLPYSQQLNGPGWSMTSASVTLDAGTAPDGTGTATTVTASSNATDSYASATVPNPALYDGETVTASVYLRAASGTQSLTLYLTDAGNSGWAISSSKTVTLTTAWQRFSVTGALQNGLTQLNLQVGGGGSVTAGHSFQVWGAQMQLGSTVGPYVATSALPVVAGQDLTNILPSSQSMNGPAWSMTNGTEAVNSTSAPDGTSTAATVTANSGSTDTYASATVPNPSLYDGETVTASVYLRVASGTQSVTLYLTDTGDNGWGISSTKAITLTTTWQRFSMTGTLQNGLTQLNLQIGGGGSVTSGQSFQLWGAQMVVGTDPAPYMPTSTGTTNVVTSQPATLVPNGLNETYSYDSFGNILQKGSFNASYTAQNQMVDGLYDAAGNLLSNYLNRMTWDAESKLVSVDGATYIYDAQGDRVEKQGVGVTDTIFFGGRPLARYSAGQWTDLIYGPNGMLAEVGGTQTAAPAYRLLDHLGTEVGTVDSTGILTNPLDYTPFGQVFSGSTNDPYLFTGKERDTESGLDYFGARYYGSSMGRWMSPDWSAKEEPVPYGKLDNPQTLNLYQYVQNNPLSRWDDDGHETQTYYGNPSYAAQQANDKRMSSTEMKIWGGVALGAAMASGAGELAAFGRAAWTAATSLCIMHCQTVIGHLNDAAGGFNVSGSWVGESIAGRSSSALAYEQQITGSVGQAFRVNGVNFDGVISGVLQEAKGPGYERLLSTSFGSSVADKLISQATSQLKAADGAPITWSFAEQGAANTVRSLFQKQGIKGINVVYQAPK